MARTSLAQKIGKRIKDYRKAAGITQEKLSISTGISQTYISGVESGNRNPSIKTLDKFAKALGVSLSEITDFSDNYKIKDNTKKIR